MINYLLYSFPKNKLEKTQKIFFYQFLSSLFISLISVFIFYIFSSKLNIITIITMITTIGGIIWFIITLYLMEKFNKRPENIKNALDNRNNELNLLRYKLKQAEYDMPTSNNNSFSTKLNWYTKDKLEYLIKEFEKLAFPTSILDSPEIKPLIFFLIPIATFAGTAIGEKAELSITIAVAFILTLIVLGIWGIVQLAESLFDIISFSNSKRQIKRIYYLLNELYIRDFDDSIPPQANNP